MNDLKYLQNLEDLRKFKKYEENRETLITIYFHNMSKEDTLNKITNELNKISTIQNLSVKKKINDRLYNLRIRIEKLNETTIVSSLFLVNDKIYEYVFTQKDNETFKEYNLQKNYIKKNSFFDINYIIDLFTNFEFNYCCQITSNHIKFKKINMNKYKTLLEYKFSNEKNMIENINMFILDHKIDILLVYGINSNNIKYVMNEKNKKIITRNDEMNIVEIMSLFSTRKYEKNNELLEKRLNDLDNPNTNLDLYVFGKLKKEILTSIELYQLKELYIEERKINLLKQIIDESYLNFTIIPIEVMNPGDVAERFISNYNGLLGIKYY